MLRFKVRALAACLIILECFACKQNQKVSTTYRALIVRADSLPIAFNIVEERRSDSIVWTIINAGEKILVEDIVQKE
ncbi:MAG: hypothetical protein RL713_1729, partial [Bacteroidota bacterium]